MTGVQTCALPISIRMDRVAMAETVSIVVTHDRLPPVGMEDFELNRVLDNPLPASPIPGSKPNFVRDEIDEPRTVDNVRVRHDNAPSM